MLSVASTVTLLKVFQPTSASPSMYALDVEIQPREAKLAVGQVQAFSFIANGTPPYNPAWYSRIENRTDFLGSSVSVNFSFVEPANFAIISVEVEDAVGNVGYDATYVYDPFSAPNVYLDDLPSTASYVVKTDATYTWAVRYDGDISWNGTDASAVIQAAINAGGKTFIKAGTYNCGSRIALKSNLTLIGEGIDVTILKLNDNVNDLFITNEKVASGSWDSFITIQDLTLDGNGENQVSGTHIRTRNTVTIYFDYLEKFLLNRVKIYNGRDYNLRLGFSESAGYVRDGVIANSIIQKTWNETGGNSDGWGKRVTYFNCEAFESKRDGFTHWGEEIAWINCISHGNDHTGFYGEGSITDLSNGFTWLNCRSYNNSMDGWKVDKVSRVRIIGGAVYENYDHGFVLRSVGQTSYYTYDIRIIGVDVFNNNQDAVGTPATNQDGILIDTYVKDVEILGSHIFDTQATHTQRRGILTGANVNKITIGFNSIHNNAQHGIYLVSTSDNFRIEHNNLFDNGNYGVEIASGCDNNIVASNYLSGNPTFGVIIRSGATNNVVELNDFRGQTNKVSNAETTSIIRRNLGYVTENSGTAPLSNNSTVTFNHGLVTTPVIVVVSFNCTGWGSWSWNASSTQITITTENSVNATVYWDVRTWN